MSKELYSLSYWTLYRYVHINLFQVSCPGAELIDFPNADACRLLAQHDGTVLNQSPVSKPLCTRAVIQSSKLKIAKDYADGEGMYSRKARVLEIVMLQHSKEMFCHLARYAHYRTRSIISRFWSLYMVTTQES